MLKKLLLSLFAIIFTVSCTENDFSETNRFLMGTLITITYQNKDKKYIDKGFEKLSLWTDIIDNDTKAINQSPIGKKITISKSTAELISLAKHYYDLSKHEYDITVYTLSSLYGFNTSTYSTPDNLSIKAAQKNISSDNIKINGLELTKKKQFKIDVGATGKGYLVDKFVDFLHEKGATNFIINAGGDLYISGNKKKSEFEVGIRDPKNLNELAAIVHAKDLAVATSGNYERSFTDANGKFVNHIFSGVKKDTVNNYSSVTVIAEKAEIADSFATIFYLLDYGSITKLCTALSLPTLVIDLDNNRKVFCGFDRYEVK